MNFCMFRFLASFSATEPDGLIALAGLAIGLLGIAVGVAFARRKPQLVFNQEGNVVVDATEPEAEDIEIAWRGTNVPSVSRTRISIWNAGALTLEGAAVVKDYPLRLKFKGQVLAVSVLARTNPENNFNALPDAEEKTSVLLEFDYFDRDHGALIDVVHGSNRWGAEPSGTVKGSSRALCERTEWWGDDFISLVPFAGMAVTGLLWLATAKTSGELITSAVFAALGCLLFTSALISSWRARPPKALRLSEKSERPTWRRFLRQAG